MDEELQKKLQERFPVLYRELGKPGTRMEWGIACGDGWFDLIWRLSEDLEKLDPNLVATNVKEKSGLLRFYVAESFVDGNPAWLKNERVWERLHEAWDESDTICEVCGASKGTCGHG